MARHATLTALLWEVGRRQIAWLPYETSAKEATARNAMAGWVDLQVPTLLSAIGGKRVAFGVGEIARRDTSK